MNAPSLITRCAHCHTVFRVTAEQLRACAGQVRCGRCLQVFDALAGLQPESVPAEAGPASPSPSQPPSPFPPAVQPEPVTAAASAPEASSEPQPAADSEAAPLAVAAVAETAPSPAAEPALAEATLPSEAEPVSGARVEAPAAEPDPVPAPQAVDSDNPFVVAAAPAAPEPRRRAYAMASGLLLLLLAAQALYAYRGEIAARHALAREWIAAACAVAGCAVELPQRPGQVMIEGSDLQLIDPARPERIQLTATLRNHGTHAVGFPALDLVLTNANDHTLARRIFLPADYLPATADRSAGLAAQAEMTVRLALDAGDVGASGFRLAVLAAAP
jgi:predicted Zn finger-like uncharacterized protein